MKATFALLQPGVLRVTGADRVDFLNGQLSNDVRGLGVPGACRALALNARGQVEFDVRVLRRDADVLVFTAPGEAPAFLERLRRFVVFDDVKLDAPGDWAVVHVAGEDAAAALAAAGLPGGGSAWPAVSDVAGEAWLMPVDRGAPGGVDVAVAAVRVPALRAALAAAGATEVDAAVLERARVLAGLADAHADGFTGLLPQECGLGAAVSYRKGCYVGQEIMARLEARGHTNRELVLVSSPGVLSRGAAVLAGDREVGVLGSPVWDAAGARFVAPAVVRKDAGAALTVTGGAAVSVERAPS